MNNHQKAMKLTGLYADFDNNKITLGELHDGVMEVLNYDKQAILSLIPEQRELMYDGDDDYNEAIREMTTALEKYFEEEK